MPLIRDYFVFHLQHHYSNCPETLYDEIDRAYREAADILTEDIRYYPHYTSFSGKEADLIKIIEFNVSAEAVLLYRIEHALYVTDPAHPLLPYLSNLMTIRCGAKIYYTTEIGPGFRVLHSYGIVLGPGNSIGSNFSIYQNVTIGQRRLLSPTDKVCIGDNIQLFAGCKVLGSLNIGSGTSVAANAVLLTDAEPDSVYAGIPAVKIK